ncbi:hypothetical protein [Aquipseudomonas alcaligenes]|uniref:Uncharacterized protein n=1 Tax=Aquipseudomonas alcaligenes (strain ATCC 14909 / DSM 50342 / CCUG 1425 / JCM 20561 / NBRC 14159 / NCIMB 9945 / NCTC 10367 / 1577) TaxID=1215092 RepID=U3AWL0_AQUA1|nr:hypothetical protein [Pseudomonas alcaligenes]GAD62039.1 hypothetical protein PA6_009_00440 [Pseudomonas alcaligenes NBRC 14159]SUD16442.1 Uncharacterised protein [Pseudomonas alcaligenes]
MEFSNAQKMIITLLTDIHSALKIQDSVDPDFVQRMVVSDNGWALAWQYPGIFETGEETGYSGKGVVIPFLNTPR